MRRFALFACLLPAWFAACGGRSPMAADGTGGALATTTTGNGGTGGDSGGAPPIGGQGPGGAGTGGSGAGGGGFNPIDCLTCVGQNCPEVINCVIDPACVQGVACAVQGCLGGGQPDLLCVIACFNGDLQAALNAIQALSCVFQTCGDSCSGFPLPGGGFPGGG